jgi:hypothetical protein
LTGRALDSADDITLGGAAVSPDGRWNPTQVESLQAIGGVCEIHLPAASAAVVTWDV